MIILGELIAMITNNFVKVSFIKITDWESSFLTAYFSRNSCQDDGRNCQSNFSQSLWSITAKEQSRGDFTYVSKNHPHWLFSHPSFITYALHYNLALVASKHPFPHPLTVSTCKYTSKDIQTAQLKFRISSTWLSH